MDLELARKLLPEPDVDFLVEKDFDCDIFEGQNQTYITFHGFDLGAAYSPRVTEMRILIPAGYPQGNLDMFYTRPWVSLASNGGRPDRADVSQTFQDGPEPWQRWSRHAPGGWRSGIDNLRTHFQSIRNELARGV